MMAETNSMKRTLGVVCGALASVAGAAEVAAPWTTVTRAGRIEARHGETLLCAWQSEPLAEPIGGAKFAASAFFHPLRTPAGFEWTAVQPEASLAGAPEFQSAAPALGVRLDRINWNGFPDCHLRHDRPTRASMSTRNFTPC